MQTRELFHSRSLIIFDLRFKIEIAFPQCNAGDLTQTDIHFLIDEVIVIVTKL